MKGPGKSGRRTAGPLRAGRPLGSLRTLWACGSLVTLGPSRSDLPLRACVSLWPLRSGSALGPGLPWRSGLALRPLRALRSGLALLTRGSRIPHCAGRALCTLRAGRTRGTLLALQTHRPGRARRALRTRQRDNESGGLARSGVFFTIEIHRRSILAGEYHTVVGRRRCKPVLDQIRDIHGNELVRHRRYREHALSTEAG